MNTPTFQEKIMTSLNLKKDKYPLSETQLSQHDSKKQRLQIIQLAVYLF